MKMKDCLISSVIILHYPMTSELEFCFEIDVFDLIDWNSSARMLIRGNNFSVLLTSTSHMYIKLELPTMKKLNSTLVLWTALLSLSFTNHPSNVKRTWSEHKKYDDRVKDNVERNDEQRTDAAKIG